MGVLACMHYSNQLSESMDWVTSEVIVRFKFDPVLRCNRKALSRFKTPGSDGFAFIGLSFLICRMGSRIPSLLNCWREQMKKMYVRYKKYTFLEMIQIALF